MSKPRLLLIHCSNGVRPAAKHRQHGRSFRPLVIHGGARARSVPRENSWEAALELINLGFLVSHGNYLAFLQASITLFLRPTIGPILKKPARSTWKEQPRPRVPLWGQSRPCRDDCYWLPQAEVKRHAIIRATKNQPPLEWTERSATRALSDAGVPEEDKCRRADELKMGKPICCLN